MTTVEEVKQSVLEALKRVNQQDSTVQYKPDSLDIIPNPNGLSFSMQFLITKDSGLIDEALKQSFRVVYDIGCSETDHLPGDDENWPKDGFHEWVCTVSSEPLNFI